MIVCENISNKKNYFVRFVVFSFDSDCIEKAKKQFEKYREQGTILNNSFDDLSWNLTNQVENTNINFGIDELNYRKNCSDWLAPDLETFLIYVKSYIALKLGKAIPNSLRKIAKELIRLTSFNYKSQVCYYSKYGEDIREFLEMFPGDSEKRERIILDLDTWGNKSSTYFRSGARILADFKTYFRFNEYLERYWNQATKQQKLFFYPIYIWWNITCILPLRVTEFLVTPRECIGGTKGNYTITIRRTNLKGGKPVISYLIDQDYKLYTYKIPDHLAEMIEEYKRLTSRLDKATLDTLFIPEAHYRYIGLKNIGRGYFTYENFRTCLNRFYMEVLSKRFTLVEDNDEELKDNEIGIVRPGDTRHIAMINLYLSGGSMSMCKELAAHSNINTSDNYFANIDKLIECNVYEWYKRSNAKNNQIFINDLTIHNYRPNEELVKTNIGWCASPKWRLGLIDDCRINISLNGEIGLCQSCKYGRDENGRPYNKVFEIDSAKQQVQDDCKFLLETIELIRKKKGSKEEILSALLRFQRSGMHYKNCLLNKLEEY